MIKIAVTTLGCKVNHYESAGIIEELARSGHEIVPFSNVADMYIINTCTVTEKTDYQSRQMVRRAQRLNPEADIIVTGCYAQVAPETFSGFQGVTLIAGTALKDKIPSMIKVDQSFPEKIAVTSLSREREFSSLPVSTLPGQTRAYLKIQDGCNSFCSYCIIPYARGRSRSRPADGVIEEIERLVRSGYREVVLTGIHLGHYGRDLAPSTNLAALLRRIEDGSSIERMRLSSLEPMDIGDDLIAMLGRSSRICRHLHIPLQSGDDSILALMERKYSTNAFRNVVFRILESAPDTAIGLDIMTGFPGETEKKFYNTMEFVRSLPVSYFHVFPYSLRPGTKAAELEGRVNEQVKKNRARLLRELGIKKREEFCRRFVGRTLPVLIEKKRDRETGLLRGFSDSYIPVLVANGEPSLLNTIVPVKTETQNGYKLLGKVC